MRKTARRQFSTNTLYSVAAIGFGLGFAGRWLLFSWRYWPMDAAITLQGKWIMMTSVLAVAFIGVVFLTGLLAK